MHWSLHDIYPVNSFQRQMSQDRYTLFHGPPFHAAFLFPFSYSAGSGNEMLQKQSAPLVAAAARPLSLHTLTHMELLFCENH